jgi:hypothetical protein
MDQIAHYLSLFPPDVLTGILTGTGVSAAIQPLKKYIGGKPKLSLFITVALSFLTVLIPWVIQTGQDNPAVLGTATVQVVFWATIAYRYIVQPFSATWRDFRSFKAEQKTAKDETTVKVNGVEETATVTAPDVMRVEENKISNEFTF